MPAVARRHPSCEIRRPRCGAGHCASEPLEPRVFLSTDYTVAPFVAVEGEHRFYQWIAHGSLGRTGDVDFFHIGRLQSGDVLTVSQSGTGSSRGTLADSLVELYRAGPNPAAPILVAFNDDGGSFRDALIRRLAISRDDDYYLKAKANDVARTGTYDLAAWLERAPGNEGPLSTVTASAEAEPNDTAATAGDFAAAWRPVTQVSTEYGEVLGTGAADGDESQYDLVEGDIVSVVIDSTSNLAAVVMLLEPTGAVVATDLGGNERTVADPLDAVVYGYHVRTSGTYVVRVSGHNNTTGSYRADVYLSRPPPRPSASVVARRVFYNNSAFDGRLAGAGPSDDAAVAPDKSALVPGQPATLANIINSCQGINGVMLDIADLRADPAAADFTFEVSVPDAPGTWIAAPLPAAIARRAGAGAGASDRVTLVWSDGSISDRWLRVTLHRSDVIGLPADDVFLFGSLVGETGDDAATLAVTRRDVVRTRARQSGAAGITDWFDFNRDGRVNALDQARARAHVGRGLTPLEPAALSHEPSDPVIVPAGGRLDMRYRRRPPFASGLADSGSSGHECFG